MSDQHMVNLLIVDRSLSDIEHIASTLRSAGHALQMQHTGQVNKINDLIASGLLDLIMVRQGASLPSISEIRTQVDAFSLEIPIIAIVDGKTTQPPAELLQAGAESLFRLEDRGHLLQIVDKELRNLHARRSAREYGTMLQESEQRFRTLLNSCHEAIAYIHEGAHIFANPSYLRLFGYASEEELEGITLMNMVPRAERDKLKTFLRRARQVENQVESVQLTGLHSDGSTFPLQIEGIPTWIYGEPSLQIWVCNIAEETIQQEILLLQEQLNEIKTLDSLTGLYNRRFFIDHLNETLKRGQPSGALLYILLINMQSINERLGLEVVEQLTADISKLLKGLLSESDVAARFSDSVFTVHTPLTDREAILELAELVRQGIEEHATDTTHALVTTTACVGVCLLKADHENAVQILNDANQACETARQRGGNQVQLYRPSAAKASQAEREQTYAKQIKDAFEQERLRLLFQPIASLDGDTSQRYKVCLQILDERQNVLPMSEVETIAERRDLGYSLDKWVIMRCLEVLTQRYQLGSGTAVFFVRLSSTSVIANHFVEWLQKHIEDTGLSGSLLVFEVTEDRAEYHFKETKALRDKLRALGCGFALSRYGCQPNAERILNHLAPDYITLNSALIEKATRSKEEALHESINKLTVWAREQNILIIADEVSSAPQMTAIWQFGIPLVQGDLVNPPSPQLDFNFQLFAG